jgi:hypothetical protein
MTHPPAGMPSWSRNARAILHTVHMGLWALLVAGAAFLLLQIPRMREARVIAEAQRVHEIPKRTDSIARSGECEQAATNTSSARWT